MAKLPTPKFNLRKRNSKSETLISLFFRFRGKRVVYSTGYSILPSEWDFELQRPIEHELRPDLVKIHNRISDLAQICKTIYIEFDYGKISITEFKIELDKRTAKKQSKVSKSIFTDDQKLNFIDFMDEQFEEMELAGMNKNTLRSIKLHIGIIKKFAQFYNRRRGFTFEDVDWQFRLKLIDWLASRNAQLAYGNKTLKILKYFLEAARRKGLHDNTAFHGKGWMVSRKKAKGQNIFFSNAELIRLAEIKFSGRLDKIRDVCLIGAGTGQRYSDFSKYTPEQFSTTYNGIPILSVISDKTAIPAKIPLNIFPWLIPTLEKHNYTTPKISMQKFNEGIKELAELVELNDQILVVNQFMGRKARIEKYYEKKYKLVSSHLCRRSFATNLYRMGFRLSQIMPMTGHATESQLREYIGIDSEQNAEEVGLSIIAQNNRF